VDKLSSIFDARGSLTYLDKDKLTTISRDLWFDAVKKRESPKSRGLLRSDEILQIDQSSDHCAFVKLKCAVPPRFYTDYLCFMKVDGAWVVVQKVFTTEFRK
jgi:hypothetical protein